MMSSVTQQHADELTQGAIQLGVSLNPLQHTQLLAYLALLIKWN
ncbi:MAG: 16S rRNA (guanine(527)-N(7))-methyltransferase RsmG, partial [Pseudomonas sp.]|nr:16S rRNA (guanine(527)-N(7))-methyltransferase RsmG [Pseudomonas sp.]